MNETIGIERREFADQGKRESGYGWRQSVICLAGLLLVGVSSPAWAQCSSTSYGNGFTCVQQKSESEGGAAIAHTVTLGAAPTAGHVIIVRGFACGDVSCGLNSANALTLTPSSMGNTFTASPGTPFLLFDNGERVGLWLVASSSTSTQFTVTCNATCYYLTVGISEWVWPSATTASWDRNVGGFSTTSATSYSITTADATTNAVDLVVGYVALSAANAVIPGAGFTEIGEDLAGDQWEAKSVASTGTQTCSASFASAQWTAVCGAIKAVTSAGGSTRKRVMVITQ